MTESVVLNSYGAGCVGCLKGPRLLYPCNDTVHIIEEVVWVPGRVFWVKKSSNTPGLDPRTVQPVVIRYADYASRTTELHLIQLKYYPSGVQPYFHLPQIGCYDTE